MLYVTTYSIPVGTATPGRTGSSTPTSATSATSPSPGRRPSSGGRPSGVAARGGRTQTTPTGTPRWRAPAPAGCRGGRCSQHEAGARGRGLGPPHAAHAHAEAGAWSRLRARRSLGASAIITMLLRPPTGVRLRQGFAHVSLVSQVLSAGDRRLTPLPVRLQISPRLHLLGGAGDSGLVAGVGW